MLDIVRSCSEAKETLAYLLWVYIVTFSVYPGVTNTTFMKSLDYNGIWFQIVITTVFNLFDTVGRLIGGNEKYFCSKTTYVRSTTIRDRTYSQIYDH